MKKLFKGWQFRSSTPSFESGDMLQAYLTAFDAGGEVGVARIGDSVLKVKGARPSDVDQLLDLRIEYFDGDSHRGVAERVH